MVAHNACWASGGEQNLDLRATKSAARKPQSRERRAACLPTRWAGHPRAARSRSELRYPPAAPAVQGWRGRASPSVVQHQFVDRLLSKETEQAQRKRRRQDCAALFAFTTDQHFAVARLTKVVKSITATVLATICTRRLIQMGNTVRYLTCYNCKCEPCFFKCVRLIVPRIPR